MSDFVITIFRGDTPTLEFTFTDPETNAPLNLSGWTLYFAVQTASGVVFINKAMTVTDPVNGVAHVSLTATETDTVGIHTAEVEARKDEEISTLAQGVVTIHPDIRQ